MIILAKTQIRLYVTKRVSIFGHFHEKHLFPTHKHIVGATIGRPYRTYDTL